MLQTATAPYVTSPLRDRSPPLHLSPPRQVQPLHSANGSYTIGAAGTVTSSSSSVFSGAGLRGIGEHLLRLDRHHPPRHFDGATTSRSALSSPASHLYGLSVTSASLSIGSLSGRGSPVSASTPAVGRPSSLYRSTAAGLSSTFGDSGQHHHQSHAMTGMASPGYHHHHSHVLGHGYMPLGGGSTPVDQGLFYNPSAVMAAALQHNETADSWRAALTQSSASLWPYNANSIGLYPCVGASYVGIDSRRKNATRESTSTLKAWLYEHIKNPYPTKGEKIMLAIITKMTLTQVSTWFANARRRLKKENKMQWSTDGKPDDDDNDDVDEDDDVIDVSNDNDNDRVSENDLHGQSKIFIEDACRTDRQRTSPIKLFSAFDAKQKHIGSTVADCMRRRNVFYDAPERCYTVDDCTHNTTFLDTDTRPSAFHFPPPPHPSHQPSLPSFMTSSAIASPSSRCDTTPELLSPSADAVDQRRLFLPFTVAVGDHSDRDSSKSDDRRSIDRQPCDVIKPRPRIWSLADVAMSAPTTRRRSDDDVIADQQRQNHLTQPGGRSSRDAFGSSPTTVASGTSSTFQPWMRKRSPSNRLPATPNFPSTDELVKARLAACHVTSSIDIEDSRPRLSCSADDDIIAKTEQEAEVQRDA